MSGKLLFAAAAGIAGAAVAIVKRLSKIEERLDRMEKAVKRKSNTIPKNWDDIADVVYDLVRGQDEKSTKKSRRKVISSAAKGASKAAGRFVWNKIARKDK